MSQYQTIDYSHEVLINLRRIIRATELYSRQLVKKFGMTSPQLLLLKELYLSDDMTTGQLAQKVFLSQATVTSILDRLETKKFVKRVRKEGCDKRKVFVTLTESGQEIMKTSPSILQDKFVREYDKLENWEKSGILSSIQRVAAMMEADDLKVQPYLVSGPISATEMEVKNYYKEEKEAESQTPKK